MKQARSLFLEDNMCSVVAFGAALNGAKLIGFGGLIPEHNRQFDLLKEAPQRPVRLRQTVAESARRNAPSTCLSWPRWNRAALFSMP